MVENVSRQHRNDHRHLSAMRQIRTERAIPGAISADWLRTYRVEIERLLGGCMGQY